MRRSYRLTPSLRPKLWGRKRLSPWFPDSDQPIGEVWYEADCDLPLLVKLLPFNLLPSSFSDPPRPAGELAAAPLERTRKAGS